MSLPSAGRVVLFETQFSDEFVSQSILARSHALQTVVLQSTRATPCHSVTICL